MKGDVPLISGAPALRWPRFANAQSPIAWLSTTTSLLSLIATSLPFGSSWENGYPTVASVYEMVNRSFIFNAQLARHELNFKLAWIYQNSHLFLSFL